MIDTRTSRGRIRKFYDCQEEAHDALPSNVLSTRANGPELDIKDRASNLFITTSGVAMATVPTTYVPGILPSGPGPHRPYTYLWEYNRNGLPWRANEFICEHGFLSSECTMGGQYHSQVGQRMVEHMNSVPAQQRDRTVVRNRLNGGTS